LYKVLSSERNLLVLLETDGRKPSLALDFIYSEFKRLLLSYSIPLLPPCRTQKQDTRTPRHLKPPPLPTVPSPTSSQNTKTTTTKQQ
jgi:hypothetical protein